MREDTNFKGSDLSCPSIYFLFYAAGLKRGQHIVSNNVDLYWAGLNGPLHPLHSNYIFTFETGILSLTRGSACYLQCVIRM